MKYQHELAIAIEAVEQASHICRAVQGNITLDHFSKEDRSPVTIADYASQAIICHLLHDAFPSDPIVAEEDASSLRGSAQEGFIQQVIKLLTDIGEDVTTQQLYHWLDYGKSIAPHPRFWTLDPIDGTKGFLRRDQYAISLALIVNGHVEVGVLACPNYHRQTNTEDYRGVLFYAVRGAGAYAMPLFHTEARPVAIHASTRQESSKIRWCESVESTHNNQSTTEKLSQMLGWSTRPIRIDSQAKYAAVACGDADIYLRLPTLANYEEKIWDHAAGVLIVQEAGGMVTDASGKPLDFAQGITLRKNRGVIATHGVYHEQLLKALLSLHA